jgi:C-terminal processing protease CtpA/Prc
MKKTMGSILLVLLAGSGVAAAQPVPSGQAAWTGSAEERVWGLMQVWAEVKFAFPHFDRLPDLDWDARVRECIPRVMAARDLESYYAVLGELVSLLRDGHTSITPPWGYIRPGYDIPPIEVQVVGDSFLIARVGETEETATNRIARGQEIVEIDGSPVRRYFQDHVLRFSSRGVKQADEGINIFYLLFGPRDSRINLTIRDLDGATRDVRLTRNSTLPDGSPFVYRFVQWNMMSPNLVTRTLPGGIHYVAIPSFAQGGYVAEFESLIDALDAPSIRGVVIDLRYNLGGNSSFCDKMIGCLIDEPVKSATMRYPQYAGALRAWGEETVWSERSWTIPPREGRRYLGPLVVLTGSATNSTGEDFALQLHASRRAVLVGGRTAGSSGNPIEVTLPGGGTLRVSTFKAQYPDGRQFVGIGILPDVEVEPTRADVVSGRDPVLAAGIEVLRHWDEYRKGGWRPAVEE